MLTLLAGAFLGGLILNLMPCVFPVISLKALASTLDSYSWVVRVSETTLMSIPRNGSAALMNHFSSSSCCSGVRVDGLNSLPIHFLPRLRTHRPRRMRSNR